MDKNRLNSLLRSSGKGPLSVNTFDNSEAKKYSQPISSHSESMDSDDNFQPLPDIDKPFLMSVEKVFSISRHWIIATGRIEAGRVKIGDKVQIPGVDKILVVIGIKMQLKILDEGVAGDNVGLLIRGVGKDEVKRGMVICHPS